MKEMIEKKRTHLDRMRSLVQECHQLPDDSEATLRLCQKIEQHLSVQDKTTLMHRLSGAWSNKTDAELPMRTSSAGHLRVAQMIDFFEHKWHSVLPNRFLEGLKWSSDDHFTVNQSFLIHKRSFISLRSSHGNDCPRFRTRDTDSRRLLPDSIGLVCVIPCLVHERLSMAVPSRRMYAFLRWHIRTKQDIVCVAECLILCDQLNNQMNFAPSPKNQDVSRRYRFEMRKDISIQVCLRSFWNRHLPSKRTASTVYLSRCEI